MSTADHKVCAREGCTNLVYRNERGRPRTFCRAACRQGAYMSRREHFAR